MKKHLGLIAALAISAPFLSAPAFAAGGESDTSAPPQCQDGQVYDKEKQKCVPAEQGRLDDDSIFETGRALAYAGRYDEAIAILSLAKNDEDPRILNFLGYSNRKLGRVLVGVGYYEAALAVDPNYTLVREYLGEAHLQMGDLVAAKQQLAEIDKRAGRSSEEYAALAARIEAFEGKGG